MMEMQITLNNVPITAAIIGLRVNMNEKKIFSFYLMQEVHKISIFLHKFIEKFIEKMFNFKYLRLFVHFQYQINKLTSVVELNAILDENLE